MVRVGEFVETEIGLTPKGWSIVHLNDCLDLLTDFEANGSFESLATNVNIYDSENYAWYVRATDLEQNLGYSEIKYADERTYLFLKKTKLYGGEVLVTKRGEIGKVYFFKMQTNFATLAPNLYLLKLNEKVVPNYIFYFFKAGVGNRLLIEKNASSTLGALYKDDIKSIIFPLPPKPEQTAIANALSDTDALIENLEKLIAKKQNIKQGARQELLRPKEDWKTYKLGDFLDYEQPTKYLVKNTEYNDNNQTPVLTAGKTFILGYTDEEFGIYHNLPIIIFDDFTTANKYVHFPFKAKSSAMKMLKAKNQRVNLRFFYEIMQTIHHPLSNHKRYWISEYQNIEIKVPSPEEQTSIAEILSDMEEEIEALEQKLHKYRMIKQGMMQVLLTGKIRLI